MSQASVSYGGNVLMEYCKAKSVHFIYLFFLIYLICLFLAVLGLNCCAQAFSGCGEQRLLFIVVLGLLIAVASLVEEHGIVACWLQ